MEKLQTHPLLGEKLLRSNYVHTSPEKIKLHDEEVAERWKILKSGKPTDLIFPLTQKLYKEGKLVDDYFGGNPNLPTSQPRKNVIEVKKKKVIGEFSNIVQAYTKNKKQKFLANGKETSVEDQVALRDSSAIKSPEITKIENKFRQCKKFVLDELEDCNPEVYPYRKSRNIDHSEIPFSQFKEILKDETSRKLKKDEYDEFVLKAASVTDEHTSSKKPYNSQDCFLKISKYNKDMNIDATYEKDKNTENIYKYDEKLGYQHPVGKHIKGKIHLPTTQRKKGKLYKIKQYIYDEDGEFLYKVPT